MATWLSGISKQLRIIRKNVFVWCGIYLLLFTLLVLRLFWLQIIQGQHYRQEAERYRNRDVVLAAKRGNLLARNGEVLALDDQRPSLYVDPVLVQYPEFVAAQLAPIIDRTPEAILADFTHQLPFVWVKHDLTPEQCTAIAQLNLPELQVKQDGSRYRIGIDLGLVEHVEALVEPLAKTLKLPVEDVRAQLGETAVKTGTTTTPPAGQRWVRGIYSEGTRRALQELTLPGLIDNKVGPSYALGVDPRPYLNHTARLSAAETAQRLSPILGSTPKALEPRLAYRPRFAWLKRNLSPAAGEQVLKLESTVFVVEPGKVPDVLLSRHDKETALSAAVNRLYTILNEKDKPEQISKDEIHRCLLPGAAPGPLGIKQVNGQPSLSASRGLLTKPIPGVIYGLNGVSLQRERRRNYPYNHLAAATLGFVTYDKHQITGAFGLEHTQDKILRGTDGRELKEIDARHMTIPERSQRVEPVNGRDVQLTLDLSIQQAAEEEINKAVAEAHAAGGACVVMDPNTGDILAMASAPSWDANDPAKTPLGATPVPLVNPIVSNFYEPGSTFKVVTVMAALEEGVTHDGEFITNCTGGFPVGNHVIHESHNAHGQVDAARLLEQSCNIGAATLSLRLGPERFLKWCRTLGFGKTVGVEVANESPGFLNARNVQAKITLANMGFGQSLAVTPLQMIAAYSSVANGGYLVKPHLVKARMRLDGSMENTPIERRLVCSEKTATLLRRYLEQVVTKGTGKSAAIPGYRVAGKTGTAQKPSEHGYGGGKYIGSFIGFMPVEKPRLAIIAIIDEPHGSIYGGVVAAPVVREVGKRALQYLNIMPSVPVKATHTGKKAAHTR